MTDKQKQAIRILNSMHERKFADDEEYFLLLDFVVGIPQPIINMPFQREEPFKPMEVWYDSATTEPTMQGKSASSGLDPIRLDELSEMQGGKCKGD